MDISGRQEWSQSVYSKNVFTEKVSFLKDIQKKSYGQSCTKKKSASITYLNIQSTNKVIKISYFWPEVSENCCTQNFFEQEDSTKINLENEKIQRLETWLTHQLTQGTRLLVDLISKLAQSLNIPFLDFFIEGTNKANFRYSIRTQFCQKWTFSSIPRLF